MRESYGKRMSIPNCTVAAFGLATLLVWSAAAAAQDAIDLYEAQAIVTGQREPERLGASRWGLEHEQGTHSVQRHEGRRQKLLQLRSNRRPRLGRWRVVRAAVRRRDLGQPQVADVPRQRRLRNVEPLGLEKLTQLFLARDGLRAHDLEDRGVTLGFHWAGM